MGRGHKEESAVEFVLCQRHVGVPCCPWVETNSYLCWKGWSWVVRGKKKLVRKAFQPSELQVGWGDEAVSPKIAGELARGGHWAWWGAAACGLIHSVPGGE